MEGVIDILLDSHVLGVSIDESTSVPVHFENKYSLLKESYSVGFD
jgi:hypothetical protein